MLFHIRRNDGSIDGHSRERSSMPAQYNASAEDEFTLETSRVRLTSPETHAVYPLRWRVSIPSSELQSIFDVVTPSGTRIADRITSRPIGKRAISLTDSRGAPNPWRRVLGNDGYDHQ